MEKLTALLPPATKRRLFFRRQARNRAATPTHCCTARFVGRPSLRGYLGQLYAITGWTTLPWLHRLRQPTLVLAGDDDPIVPLPNGRILAHRIPDARLHTVHGGRHLFLLEQPAEMAALVTRCLAEQG
jgi:pimeloyl-ACP methyl ester carboxylesterase